MKKIIALLMVALMAVSFTACAKTPEKNIKPTETTPVTTNAGTDNNAETTAQEITAEALVIDINDKNADRTVLNDSNIRITLDEIAVNKGYVIPFSVENNSDKDIMITGGYYCVNNIVFPSFISEGINKGENGSVQISIRESDLESCDIDEIGVVEFRLSIAEKDSLNDITSTGDVKLVFNENVSLIPEADDDIIFSNNDIKIYEDDPSVEESEVYEYVTRFMIVNDSNKELLITTEETTVNGVAIDTNFRTLIPAGKIVYTDLLFAKTDLDSNKIKDIEEVKLKFGISNRNDLNDKVTSDIITIDAD